MGKNKIEKQQKKMEREQRRLREIEQTKKEIAELLNNINEMTGNSGDIKMVDIKIPTKKERILANNIDTELKDTRLSIL